MKTTREQFIADFVQQMKDDGSWDLLQAIMIPGPDGPLSKSDMEDIWARQRRPVDTGFVCSIGPAVDLPQLERTMDEFSRQPWIQPPQGGEVE